MNDKISYQALLEDIDKKISEGWSSVYKIDSLDHDQSREPCDNDEEYGAEMDSFKHQLESTYISICFLLESLGCINLLQDFKAGFSKFNGNLTSFSRLPYIGELDCGILGYFWKYYEALSPLCGVGVKEREIKKDLDRFENILKNTPKIVSDREIEPGCEIHISKAIYNTLTYFFPDTVREFPISQVTKNYKFDIGVRSLKAVAEFKYAVTEEEAKKAIGQFYEDMHGYAGNPNWKHFYAVIYMTKHFFTYQQIEAEFAHVEAAKNWHLILVCGEGGRR